MKHSESSPQPESFKAVERRIAVTCERLPDFPHRRATLTRLIAHLQKRVQDSSNAALKRYQLNYVSYNTLMMMYGADEFTINPSELSAATGEKPANCTRICDELEERGLIRRHAALDDRRRVELTLTAQGRKLVERLQPAMWELLDALFAGFTDDELGQLTAQLKKTLVNVEQTSS
jgi:MarR family transcriptional repressor of emrRAB